MTYHPQNHDSMVRRVFVAALPMTVGATLVGGLLGVLVLVGVWLHSWWLIGPAVLGLFASLLWHPKYDPASMWARRMHSFGRWLPMLSGGAFTALLLLGLVLSAGMFWSLWNHLTGWAVFFLAVTVAFKVGVFRAMSERDDRVA